MIVRPATEEDIGELVEMGRRMHEEGAYAFLPYEAEKVRRLITGLVERPDCSCALVAEHDHGLAGMLGGYLTDYFFCDAKVACDLVLFVERDYRGSSAAARLIQGFREWARARGARELCLGISTNINTEAIGRFYRSLGFTQVGGIYKQRL
jgi:GNAT superfamily N-acetyltransferase